MKQNSTQKIRTFGRSLKHVLLVMLTALSIFGSEKADAQQTLYGISGWQDTAATLYKLDPNTGAVISTIGNTGLSFVTNMTINPLTGEIYVQNSQLVDSAMVNGQMEYYWQGMYYLVDSITAVPTFVATTTTDTTYSALEPPYIIYSPNGNTYTIDLLCQCPRDFIGVAWSNVCNLYFKDEFYISQIDTMTGGLLNYAQVMGVAHNMLTLNINDIIYSGERLSNGFMLKTISPDFNTFTATLTNIGQSPVMNMAAIAFGRYQPTVTASNTLNFCVGGSVTLTSSTADGYQWKLNGVDIPNATQQTYEATQSGDYTVEVTLGCGRHLSNATTVTVNPLPVLSTSVTNVSCFGFNNGAIDLSVSAGSFIYDWSNGAGTQDITNLAPGTYNVTVTSTFGCTATTSATITQPSSALTASSGGQTNPTSGNNGSAIVVANGGTPPYTYSWSPSGGTDDTATGLGAGTYTATVTDANGCTASQSFTLTQACNVSFTGNVTNVACNGQSNGAIDITITSGSGSYAYSWSNGATTQDISNLAAGTYTVTVSTSNGCSHSQSFTVTQPETLAITAGVTNVTCYGANNGSIDVTVTGGTAPYTYVWADVNSSNYILWIIYYMNQWCNTNNSSWPGSNIHTQDRSGLENGCYYVKVIDANGCTAIASFTVSEPGPICVSHTKNNASCANNNGSINQTVSGGTAPYTYLWSNGATTQDISGLSAGTYSVVITDANGCTENKSYTITQATANISVSHTKCNALCTSPSGSINISVSGGNSPYTYQWSNGATTQDISNLTPGTYTVVITDQSGCTKTQSYTIGSTSGDYSVSYTKCNANCANTNGNINISVYGGNAPYTYQWSNGATTQDIYNLSAGTYTVVVTDENGCQETRTYTISQEAADFYVSVSKCNANCANTGGSINISVSGGNAPYTYQWSNGATTQDIYNLAAGTYTVVITDASGCTETKSYTISQSTGNLNVSINVSPVYPVSGQEAYTIYLGYGTQGVTLSASISGGSGPYTKVWSTSQTTSSISVSPTVTTIYTLTVTDANGCTETANKVIKVKNVQAPNNKIYVCHNGTTTAVYSSQVYNHLCHGDDLGACTNNNNCKTTEGDESKEAEEPTLLTMSKDIEFSVYPNPSNGQFVIDIPTLGDVDILVTDVAGKVVDRKFVKDNMEHQLKYNLGDAAKGVYMLRVATEGGIYQTKITLQ